VLFSSIELVIQSLFSLCSISFFIPCHLIPFFSISSHSCLNCLIQSSHKFNNKSTKEIGRIIKSIEVKNLHVCDGITTKMLKIIAYISSPLNYICNKSIRSGTFPALLKYSIIKLLFKKGDKKAWLITDQSLY
jgi:hypothetical protein